MRRLTLPEVLRHQADMSKPSEIVDPSRRNLTSLLGAMGLVALAGCLNGEGTMPSQTTISETLSGTGFIWFDTIAAMKALNGTTTSPAVIVGGYYAPGDGGGGVFYWNSTSTIADNGGTVIKGPAATGRWLRLYEGPLNVRWFGAKGDNVNADDVGINAAIAAAGAMGGAEVYVPPGVYRTTTSINMTVSNVSLVGSGWYSQIAPATNSTFDTVVMNGSPASPLYQNQIRNLTFLESGKADTSGSHCISMRNTGWTKLIDVLMSSPVRGAKLLSVNTITLERVIISPLRGKGSDYGLLINGNDTDGPTDVVTLDNVAIGGLWLPPPGTPSGLTHSTHGIIVDGRVATVSGYKIYTNNIDGVGIWFRNTGTSTNPGFCTIYGYERDFGYLEAVVVDKAFGIHFTEAQIHGSAAAPGITVYNTANNVSFTGGTVTSSYTVGFNLLGNQIAISNVNVAYNSAQSVGAWAGIHLDTACRMVTVTGCKCGDAGDGQQGPGIKILSGADQFAITGNVCFHNNPGGTSSIVNSAGLSASRIVANNAVATV